MIPNILRLSLFVVFLWSGLLLAQSSKKEELDHSRLIQPDVAQALGLSDEQSSRVIELLQQRSQALVGAADGNAVISSFEEKLAAVLNDRQRQKFRQLGADKTIFFNFRGQEWSDVLVWFAKQADLSLVASTTPEGKFIYSSTQKYSPSEAIVLLNRVLQSKGHTLIRKGRLLFCVDLTKGLPVGLIPRVSEEELADLGELEFATVIIPLGGRNPETVNEEVKPLLGDHGRSLALTQTNQLMLTGTAGALRAIGTLIKAIPVPKAPVVSKPAKAETAELQMYTVDEGLAVETVVETLRQLLPKETKLTSDMGSQQINALCTPSQHALIKSILAKMKENYAPGKAPYVESYRYENANPATLAEQLKFAVPDIAVNVDEAGERLLVFAAPAKQATVRSTLQRLDVTLVSGDEQVLVYDVSRGDPSKLVEILSSMVPNAEVTTNAQQRKVIVRATPQDHQTVDQLIEQLEFGASDKGERKLESYELGDKNRSIAERLIRELHPDLKIVVDNLSDQLLIWATDQQHAQIKQAISKLPQPNERELVLYPLAQRRLAREIRENVSNLIKDVTIREHDGGRQLAVIAVPDKQDEVRQLIEKLEAARRPEPNRTLAFYPLRPAQKARFDAMRSLLSDELEGMKTFENSPDEIGVWATGDQHQLVKQMVSSVEGVVDASKRQLKSYTVSQGEPAAVAELLTELYSEARIVPDETAGRVMVWARAADQAEIAESVRQLDAPASERNKQTLQVYPVGETNPNDVAPVLQKVAPEASIAGDRSTKSIIVWATKRDHEKIVEAVRQFRENDPNERVMAVYPAGGREYYAMRTFLRELTDDASLTYDEATNQFGVLATAEEHISIKKALELFAAADVEEQETSIVSYPVNMDADWAIDVLRQIAPKAKLIDADRDTKVVAMATAEDHQKLKTAIDQMSSDIVEEGWDFRIYKSNRATASAAHEVFRQMSPSAVVVPDGNSETISIWAPTEDHAKFAKVVASIQTTRVTEQRLQLYKLAAGIEPSQATSVVNQVAPVASIVSSSKGQIVVIGAAEDHDRIKSSIDDLNSVAVDIPKTSVAIRRVDNVNPASVVAAVQPQLAEGDTIEVDADGKSVLVRAPESRQAAIGELVDHVIKELPQVTKTEAHVYRLEHVRSSVAQPALAALLPAATFAVDESGRTLLATATVDDHLRIKQAITQLDVERDEGVASEVYRLEHINGSILSAILQRVAPTATIVPSDDNNMLVITATSEEHESFRALISDVDQPSKNKPVLVTYAVPRLQPTTIVTSLQQLISSKTFSVTADEANSAVLARATLDEHEIVADVIDKLSAGKKQSPNVSLKVHTMGQIEVEGALPAFQSLFAEQPIPPKFTYAKGSQGTQLMAVATAEQHQRIDQAVKQLLEDAASGEPVLLVYAVNGLDAGAVEDSLDELFAEQNVRVSADSTNGAVLVKASLEDHQVVNEVINQLNNELTADAATSLKVYPLGFVDSNAALPALEALFAARQPKPTFSIDFLGTQLMAVATSRQHLEIGEAVKQIQGEPRIIQGFQLERVDPLTAQNAINNLFISAAEPPSINVDDRSQKIFVRGFREQIDAVKDLLVGMGEGNLDGRSESQSTFKVLQVSGDSQSLLEQIQKVWPQLNDNPLQIVAPQEFQERPDSNDGAKIVHRIMKPVAIKAGQGATNRATPAPEEEDAAAKNDAANDDPPLQTPLNRQARPPIVAVPSEGRITIMSDDPQAIREFEKLLNLLPKHAGTRMAGNFSVVLMREASAVSVSRMLEKLIRSMPEPELSGFSGVQVAADERMNAVIVHGRRHERENVEQLLRILDSSNVPNSLARDIPTIVAVANTDAARIIRILQTVYKTQLQTGGRAKDISIPETVDSDVAAVLKQINAANAAPLLTLEVDEVTNSIVILAPQNLAQEVKKLIQDLDNRAVASAARGVSIIQLKSMNTTAVEEALERLLNARR